MPACHVRVPQAIVESGKRSLRPIRPGHLIHPAAALRAAGEVSPAPPPESEFLE